jgi:hypothetical protein
MKNRQAIIGALLGLAILAVVTVAVWLINKPAATDAREAKPAPQAYPPSTQAAPVAGSGALPPAPWLTMENPQPPAASSPSVGARKPGIDDIQNRLAAMTAGGRAPSAREVDTLLADLQRNQGRNDVAGVDLAVLRENLARAEEIQRLAKEMEQIALNPKQQDIPRLQTTMARIQQLQAGIKADVSVKPSAGSGK